MKILSKRRAFNSVVFIYFSVINDGGLVYLLFLLLLLSLLSLVEGVHC